MRPRILISNDDGLRGPGLRPLLKAAQKLGHAIAIVPDQERSAQSHALTLRRPVRLWKVEKGIYATDGSPADCVRLGVIEIFKGRVDLVLSGINRGYNLGEDVTYSGTVAAAREAVLMGIPAVAFSQSHDCLSYKACTPYISKISRLVLKHKLPPGICLNVNFPDSTRRRLKEAILARLGRQFYSREIKRGKEGTGRRACYWLKSEPTRTVHAEDSDIFSVRAGHVPITPLHIDSTDLRVLESLRSWSF